MMSLFTSQLSRDARRVAFINTEDDTEWRDQMQLFQQALELPADVVWDEYNIFSGEKPDQSAMERQYAAVVVCGSHVNVSDPHEWLTDLFDLIKFSSTLPSVRLLGVCFGCQAVAAALGGSVGPNVCGSYVFRNEKVVLAPMLQQTLVDSAIIQGPPPASLNLLATHGQCVHKVPDGGHVLAWSDGSPHELFVCGEHSNIIGCQCHPEYTPSLLCEKLTEPLRTTGVLSGEAIAKAVQSFELETGSPTINALLRAFLMEPASQLRR
jgi:GMP synthase-like glutamine amidotransferase